MFDISKYKFYRNNNKVIAVSTYAGKTVRGIASCDPRDDFNEVEGQRLAAARCNTKIALKRYKRATQKRKEAEKALNEALDYYNRMCDYYNESDEAVTRAVKETAEILESMGEINGHYN